jgi:hypothetical protein
LAQITGEKYMDELEFLGAIGESDLKEDTLQALVQLFRRVKDIECSIKDKQHEQKV